MDIESKVYMAAFMGAAMGLPAGFLLIQIIRFIQSKFESRGDAETDILEWAMVQRGSVIVDETQIANNWVRTVDISNLKTFDKRGDLEDLDLECADYVTQVVGSIGTPPPVPAATESEALANHEEAVLQTRKAIGLKNK